ncbi:MAG: hypothetical protein RLZZ522_1583, partial [Verrucomicrobiota bacterium]
MKRHFSILLFLIFALLSSASLAQVTPPAPPELTTLRTRYQSDLNASQKPIRSKYITALESMVRAITKSGDLDAALAVQQELNAIKGVGGTATGGKVTPELTALKSLYEANVQTASEAIQIRYIKSLETLQDKFTKDGNLTAALAV